jgi:flagellar hook-length control protein FliK
MRPIPSTAPAPPPRTEGSERSGPPGGASPGDFAALLDQTTARTAPAEGPKTRPAIAEHRGGHREAARELRADGDAGETNAVAATAAGTDAPAPAQPAAAAPGAAPEAGTTESADPAMTQTAAAVGAVAAPAAAPAPAPASPAVTAASPAVTAAGTAVTAAGTAATAAVAAPPNGPAALAAEQAPIAGATQAEAPTAAPAAPAGTSAPMSPDAAPAAAQPATDGHRPGRNGSGEHRGRGDQPDAPAPAPLRPEPAAATPATAASAPADAPAATSASAPAPVAAATPAPATSPAAAPVPTAATSGPAGHVRTAPALTHASLHATVDRIHELVRISTTRGGARATLQLKPAELGAVDVRLRTTGEGLVATITAQDESGLAALQQAGAELRRNLEDRGVTLHRLDLQLGDASGGDRRGAGGAGSGAAQHGAGGTTAPHLPGSGDEPADDELTVVSAVAGSRIGLVDVRA